ncbi:MAG: PQQ-like beta-propeller repeat protein [Pirellulaceae bacterium]|nr:PQQ-like beta-propeller repeat protein [Pirellulaceae bacterium]
MSDQEQDPNAADTTPVESAPLIATAADTKPALAPEKRLRLMPPIWVWCLAGLWCVLLVLVRVANVSGDHAIVNILTLVFGFLAVSALVSWFAFLSGYPRVLRFGGLTVLIGAISAFCMSYRIYQVSGELVPMFRLRHAASPDELLKQPPVMTGKNVSVRETTPDDFPEFLGARRLGRVDTVRLAPDWTAQPPKELWRRPIGAGWSGFAVVNGVAMTMEQRGDHELVTCYRVEDGALIWSYTIEGRHKTFMGGIGPRATPTINDGRVYSQGAFGTVSCLDGASGAELWREELLGRYGIPRDDDVKAIGWGRSGSPLVVDDLVIVPAGGPRDGPHVSLVAFDKTRGTIAWESGDRQISYSSPVLATLGGKRQVLIVNESNASGHDPKSGRMLWQVEWPGGSTTNASVSQAVPLPPNQFMLSKGYGGGAALFQLTATRAGKFEVRDVWRNTRVLKTKFCNVVVHHDHVYGLSDGILECVELATGQRVWKGGRYGHGQLLGVRNHLLVQLESGKVALVDATPEGFREVSRFSPINGKTWNNPTLYGNRLLVRNAEEAACYELVTD